MQILCTACGVPKDRDAFYATCIRLDGKRGRCKTCISGKQADWWKRTNVTRLAVKARYYERLRAQRPPKAPRIAQPRSRKNIAYHARNRAMVEACEATKRARRYGARIVEQVYLNVLYERDQGICHICQLACTIEDASRDHLIPLSWGGEHSYANCALAHKRCNSRRGGELSQTHRALSA
jgi:5-methylcytosine-specific restriction endonuclease McrA